MGQLPNNDIPMNRSAMGYRYEPKTEAEEQEAAEKLAAFEDGTDYESLGFERPITIRRSNK